ncbi:abortive infection family protein [Cupriavidus sp. TMH.W2]|uniref:abortive infection family protein n=1 Tax=Cupriavidus sp. TMH.W2 TaxID=3434465 RepID=UPI003D76ADC0
MAGQAGAGRWRAVGVLVGVGFFGAAAMTAFEDLMDDPVERNRAFVAIRKAIVPAFDEIDWRDFAAAHSLVPAPRLLKGSQWKGNEDYPGHVMDLLARLRGADNTPALFALASHPKLRDAIRTDAPQLFAAVCGTPHVPLVVAPPQSPSEIVRVALEDALTLIQSPNGPASAVDRLHTALHGYFREVCRRAGIEWERKESVTLLFRRLRDRHSAFKKAGPHADDVERILNNMGSTLDTLGKLRNHASVGHANEQLLDRIDATLVVNAVHTIFNYIAAKVGD